MKKKESSAQLGTRERERLENAISAFLRASSQHPEVLQQGIFNWLTTSELGAEVVKQITTHTTEKLRKELDGTVDAVLLLHNDGWMEVFGPKRLRIKAYTMPWYNVPEDMARDLVEMQMPERLANLMWPNVMDKMPGFKVAFQVTQIPVEWEGETKLPYTWKQCENTWTLEKRQESPASS